MPTSPTLTARFHTLAGLARQNVQVARLALAVETSKPLTRGAGYALLGAGVAVGVLASFLLQLFAVLVMVAFGFALGYGARSYVSKRRRDRFYRERLTD